MSGRRYLTSAFVAEQLRVLEDAVQNGTMPRDVYAKEYSRILGTLPGDEKLPILKKECHRVSAITVNKVIIQTPVVETIDEKRYEDLYGVVFDGIPENLMTMTEDDRGKNSTKEDPEGAVMKFTPPTSKPFSILLKKLDLNKWEGYENCSHFRVGRYVSFYNVVPYQLSVDAEAEALRVNVK